MAGSAAQLPRPLRIVAVSDTHELHRELELPNGDLLIHAGDFTMFGKSLQALLDFNAWLGELPHAHKVVVPGNHEFLLEAEPELCRVITNATVLVNDYTMVRGVKIWGSPVTPVNGAFGRGDPRDRERMYSAIPEDVDILITHGPPYGILDSTDESAEPAGDRELRNTVRRVKPRLHIFGHIHAGYGVLPTRHTMFINAALMHWDGGLGKRPISLNLGMTKLHT